MSTLKKSSYQESICRKVNPCIKWTRLCGWCLWQDGLMEVCHFPNKGPVRLGQENLVYLKGFWKGNSMKWHSTAPTVCRLNEFKTSLIGISIDIAVWHSTISLDWPSCVHLILIKVNPCLWITQILIRYDIFSYKFLRRWDSQLKAQKFSRFI
jgi:hypothetical protein